METYDFSTEVVRKQEVRGPVSPITTPIYATSTYILDSADHGAALSGLREVEGKSPWFYSRWGNPTTDVTANLINRLEHGFGTLITSSGMAAISSTLFALAKNGDHIICPKPVYGGTHEVFEKVLPQYGVEVTFVDGTDINAFKHAIQDNTVLMYGETPANPTMSILDLDGFGQLGKDQGIVTAVDSTFGTPYNQNPLKHGVDISLHSATKYLGGHSDIIAGSITSSNKQLYKQIFATIKLFGGILSPFESYLLTRGIKTLDVRMERHNHNGLKLAEFLEHHEKINSVYYPGLASHPQHEIAKNQMKGFGGMIAFDVKGGLDASKIVIENLKLITLAVSLGGVESLIESAPLMTHSMVPREKRLEGGITDGLIRFSVGLESPSDLINDLDQAMKLI